jgi:hypothetical protein
MKVRSVTRWRRLRLFRKDGCYAPFSVIAAMCHAGHAVIIQKCVIINAHAAFSREIC